MWIWGQNLSVLVKTLEVCIEDKTKIWAEGYLIGKYSTEGKALRVLDDIENHLKGPYDIVFQMPQDEDVGV